MQPILPTKEALLHVLSTKKMIPARRYVNKESERISLIKDRAMLSTSAISGDRCVFLKDLDEREIVHLLKEEYDACLSYKRAPAKKVGVVSGAIIGMATGISTGLIVSIFIPPVGAAIVGGSIAAASTAAGTGALAGIAIHDQVRYTYVQAKIIQHDDDRYIRLRLKINEIELKIVEFQNNHLQQHADQLKVASIYFKSVADIYLLSRNTLKVVHS